MFGAAHTRLAALLGYLVYRISGRYVPFILAPAKGLASLASFIVQAKAMDCKSSLGIIGH